MKEMQQIALICCFLSFFFFFFSSESSERGRYHVACRRAEIISWQPAKPGHGLGTRRQAAKPKSK